MTKKCSRCGVVRGSEDYGIDRKATTGLTSECKPCRRAEKKAKRLANLEVAHEAERRRANKPEAAAKAKDWRAKNIDRRRLYSKAQQKRDRVKVRARVALSKAKRSGAVTVPDFCSSCGLAGPVEGHHEDYSKPLEVTWLCTGCHTRLHRGIRALAAAEGIGEE